MPGPAPVRDLFVPGARALRAAMVAWLCLWIAGFAVGQVNGVPPSVTSIQLHVPPFLPNIMPSVTSLGPYGIGYRPGPTPPPYGVYPRDHGHGYGNNALSGYNSGAWISPYYFPAYDAGYGYDTAASGPYLYSGPPSEQTLHIVVDLPPAKHTATPEADDEAMALPTPPMQKHEEDAKPLEATVLVFRDGHQQEVSNYAIMGQTLYIFDSHRQKIGLGDLDVPATIKLNDDRGVEFHLPASNPS